MRPRRRTPGPSRWPEESAGRNRSAPPGRFRLRLSPMHTTTRHAVRSEYVPLRAVVRAAPGDPPAEPPCQGRRTEIEERRPGRVRRRSPEKRSAINANVRAANTRPEMAVRRIVHPRGYRFPLHHPSPSATSELLLPKHRRVVLVRGYSGIGTTAVRVGVGGLNRAHSAPKLALSGERGRERGVPWPALCYQTTNRSRCGVCPATPSATHRLAAQPRLTPPDEPHQCEISRSAQVARHRRTKPRARDRLIPRSLIAARTSGITPVLRRPWPFLDDCAMTLVATRRASELTGLSTSKLREWTSRRALIPADVTPKPGLFMTV